jgi:hypothetical protein
MSATEVIDELNKLPAEDQKRVFVFLAQKLIARPAADPKQWFGRQLTFEEACDIVFRENRELLSLLAK